MSRGASVSTPLPPGASLRTTEPCAPAVTLEESAVARQGVTLLHPVRYPSADGRAAVHGDLILRRQQYEGRRSDLAPSAISIDCAVVSMASPLRKPPSSSVCAPSSLRLAVVSTFVRVESPRQPARPECPALKYRPPRRVRRCGAVRKVPLTVQCVTRDERDHAAVLRQARQADRRRAPHGGAGRGGRRRCGLAAKNGLAPVACIAPVAARLASGRPGSRCPRIRKGGSQPTAL